MEQQSGNFFFYKKKEKKPRRSNTRILAYIILNNSSAKISSAQHSEKRQFPCPSLQITRKSRAQGFEEIISALYFKPSPSQESQTSGFSLYMLILKVGNLPHRSISMSLQRIFLQYNAPATRLYTPFAAGSLIEFLSTSFDGNPDGDRNLDNTNVNLVRGSDILLHISIRRGHNFIVFNTQRNGRWDPNPQTIPLTNVFSGPGATISVTSTATSYRIRFDGSHTVHTYNKRISADATAVSYRVDNNLRSVLSNLLIVDIYGAQKAGQFISPISLF